MIKKTSVLVGILALAGASAPVLAQETKPVKAKNTSLEEIVVTVRKTTENLQDVPLAITSLSAQTLERASVLALSDISDLTPGLIYQDFNVGALSTPVIRGLAQSNIQGRENNVGLFLDGIYIPSRNNLDLELLDLQRIEIVKGPQSALYGRSTFAGSINYVTKAPAQEPSTKVTLSAGTDEYYDGQINVSGPITDTLSGTAAIAHREFDGTIKNSASPNNLGGYDNSSAIGKLQWDVMEDFSATFTGFYSTKDTESAGIFQLQPDCGVGANPPFGPTYVCGDLPFRDTVSVDPRATGAESDAALLAMTLEYDLGPATLTSVTGYTHATFRSITDYDANAAGAPYVTVGPAGTANLNTFFFNHSKDETLSQEFRLNGGGDVFQWLGGVYWTKEESSSDSAVSIDSTNLAPGQSLANVAFFFNPNPYLTPNPTTPNFTPTQATADVDIYAIFGRGQWNINDRNSLSLEARYTWEDKNVNGISSFTGAPSGYQSNQWTYFTPRISYDFKVTEDMMLYASAATGTKSGGFNTSYSLLYPDEQFYDEETNYTYEVGTKGLLLNGDLRYDVAVYYIDWNDMQISGASQDPAFFGSIVTNAGAATSKGFEIQIDSLITDWLDAGGGYAYADPKFSNGITDSSIASVCGNGSLCTTDVGGKQVGRTVKNQLNLYLQFHAPITNAWEWYARGDYIYRDESPTRSANLQFIDSWSIVNARVGATNNHWDVALWAKNLFDEGYVTSQIRQPALNNFTNPTTVIEANTRQVALTVSYSL